MGGGADLAKVDEAKPSVWHKQHISWVWVSVHRAVLKQLVGVYIQEPLEHQGWVHGHLSESE